MATKKKDPSELKQRGRKKDEYDNGDLSAHLIGVDYLKDLTFAAQTIIRKAVKEFNEKGNSDRAYDTSSMLYLVKSLSRVTTESVKQKLDSSDLFDNDDYKKTSVNNYKQVLITIATRLSELKEKKGFIRKDQKDSDDYFEDRQALNLIELLETGGSIDEVERLIAKYKASNKEETHNKAA